MTDNHKHQFRRSGEGGRRKPDRQTVIVGSAEVEEAIQLVSLAGMTTYYNMPNLGVVGEDALCQALRLLKRSGYIVCDQQGLLVGWQIPVDEDSGQLRPAERANRQIARREI